MLKRLHLNKFIADVASLSTSRVCTMILGFAGSVVLARLLGPEGNGIVTAILVIPYLVRSFAELGLQQSTLYYLGKRAYDDQSVLFTVTYLTSITSVLSTLAVLVVYLLNGSPQRYGWGPILVSVLLLPCYLVRHYGEGVLLAKQRIRDVAIVRALERVIYLPLLVLTVPLLPGIMGALLATVCAAGVVAVYMAGLVSKYGRLRPIRIPGLPTRFVKVGFVYAVALFVVTLGYRLDVLLLERLSTPREVGIYSIGVQVAQLLWLLPAALTTVNFARSAAAEDPLEHARKTALLTRLTFWGGLLPLVALYLLAPWVIPVVYGAEFAGSAAIVQGILPGVWMALIFKVLQSDLAGRGRPAAALWVYVSALLINIGLNLWWIPHHGALGSAWASSISYCVAALMYAIAYAKMSSLRLSQVLLPSGEDIRRLFRDQLGLR
jgi:O-antigen/teichoic acid export membrane protein